MGNGRLDDKNRFIFIFIFIISFLELGFSVVTGEEIFGF